MTLIHKHQTTPCTYLYIVAQKSNIVSVADTSHTFNLSPSLHTTSLNSYNSVVTGNSLCSGCYFVRFVGYVFVHLFDEEGFAAAFGASDEDLVAKGLGMAFAHILNIF